MTRTPRLPCRILLSMGRTGRARRLPAAGLLFTLALASSPSRAQTVVGHLVDSESGRGVVSGLMALTDRSGEVVDAAMTDDSGRFRLSTPAPGDYLVVARATGYVPGWDGILELGEGGYIEVTFYLRPAPFELPGVTASVERTDRYLATRGFYDRRKAGFGYFIGPEELERRMPSDTWDLVRGIPGISVLDYRTGGALGQSVVCQHKGRDGPPDVYVDGIRRHFPDIVHTPGPDVDLDAVIGTETIAAMELYPRTAHVPLQYGGLNGACVILIWTKH